MKKLSLSILGLGALIFSGCSGATDEASSDSSESNLGAPGTVEAAVSTSCTTSVVRGLAEQLVEEIECIKPGTLTRIDGIANLSIDSRSQVAPL